MRKSVVILALVALCGLTLLVRWHSRGHQPPNKAAPLSEVPTGSTARTARVQSQIKALRSVHVEQPAEPKPLSEQDKEALEKLNQFAAVARLYNYDPTFVASTIKNNGRYILSSTKTHTFN